MLRYTRTYIVHLVLLLRTYATAILFTGFTGCVQRFPHGLFAESASDL
jgi:hypothetical protein